jgi:Transposase DDE domain
MDTPFFPPWRSRLAAFGRRLVRCRKATLSRLEEQFGQFLPPHLLSQNEQGPNSRERVFPLRRTFWALIFQVLTPGTSCREVVRQLQALLGLHSDAQIDAASSAYCQSRARFPLQRLQDALRLSAQEANRRSGDHGRLAGRPVKVVDGSTVQAPDTPANQRRFPQPSAQRRGCGFPVLKLSVLFSLASGAIETVAIRNLHWHDLRLFRTLWSHLRRGDILLGDRAYGDYVSLAQLARRGIDLVCRLHQTRKVDFRRGKRLGPDDALFTWKKGPIRPRYLTPRQWRAVPGEFTVRVLRLRITQPGFRTRRISLVTTLLDPQRYCASALFGLYLRRWRLELCLRDLKTTMGMERLRTQSPTMLLKELHAYLVGHNLIRCVMAEAGGTHGVSIERISFKGTVDAVRHFSAAWAQARNQAQRRRLQSQLLAILADDRLPERPGRREPRAVKRRPKPYQLLTHPRHTFSEVPHRTRYRRPTSQADSLGLN